MAQRDFCSLELTEHSDDLHLDTYPSLDPVAVERISCGAEDAFVPINFIPDAVCMMIKNWELSELKRQNLTEVTASESINRVVLAYRNFDDVDYEPMRCMKEVAPPKRFYRSFSKSIARKLLDREKDAVFSICRPSTT